MVQDFRQPSPHVIQAGEPTEPAQEESRPAAGQAERSRTVVLLAIRTGALIMAALGVWMLLDGSSLLAPDTARLLGTILLVVAVFDLVLAKFLQTVWSRRAHQGG